MIINIWILIILDIITQVSPLGSNPSPRLVTSLFYRIGRPRPGPVYTSRRTAAWVFFPSWRRRIPRVQNEETERENADKVFVNPLGERTPWSLRRRSSDWCGAATAVRERATAELYIVAPTNERCAVREPREGGRRTWSDGWWVWPLFQKL